MLPARSYYTLVIDTAAVCVAFCAPCSGMLHNCRFVLLLQLFIRRFYAMINRLREVYLLSDWNSDIGSVVSRNLHTCNELPYSYSLTAVLLSSVTLLVTAYST